MSASRARSSSPSHAPVAARPGQPPVDGPIRPPTAPSPTPPRASERRSTPTGRPRPLAAAPARLEPTTADAPEAAHPAPLRVLFATSELFPWVKVGGLGDVAFALPLALQQLADPPVRRSGATPDDAHAAESRRPLDLRVVLPAYPAALAAAGTLTFLGRVRAGFDAAAPTARIFAATLDARVCGYKNRRRRCRLAVWLVDLPDAFDRPGNPYNRPDGEGWPDNAERFLRFSLVVAALARGALTLSDAADGQPWRADVVHANDWQTGPALLALGDSASPTPPPRRVFTIHNLAYDARLSYDDFQRLALPAPWWSIDGAEFWGQFSAMKSGLVGADVITTVSPRYAQEIRTPAFGEGFDGLLCARADRLVGILNGIDTCVWDPAQDPLLPIHYTADDDIRAAKQALRAHLTPEGAERAAPAASPGAGRARPGTRSKTTRGFDRRADSSRPPMPPLIGFIGRFVEQKGLDLVLAAIPRLLVEHDLRFVLLGSGQAGLEARARELARLFPEQVTVHIGYDETLSHRIEAASDFFLMPSRFEPCGLNQLYSLRYGTLPIVSPIGGLADSVVDATDTTLAEERATGFHLRRIDPEGVVERVRDVLELWHHAPATLDAMARRGMRLDLGWRDSARRYRDLYERPNRP